MLDDLRELYQSVILDHSRSPRNFGRPAHPTCDAQGHNPMCGDVVHVYVVLSDDHRIEDIAFEGKGCAISVASASFMTEIAKGKRIEEALKIFEAFHDMCTTDRSAEDFAVSIDPDIIERLSVLSGVRGFPMRVKCATLSWHTMKAALEGRHDATTE